MRPIKPLLRKYLGIKSFMLIIPEDKASSTSVRKCKQICMTHLAVAECVLSIKLAGIMDIETMTSVGVLDENGNYVLIEMSLCSILMEIMVPSLGQPLFLVIAETGDGEFEVFVPTGRER